MVLNGIKVDTSVYVPNSLWDGCGWMDRDGSVIAVNGYANHWTVVNYLELNCGELSSEDLLKEGYLHVSETLISRYEPSTRQINALFEMANHWEVVRVGVADGVYHDKWKMNPDNGRLPRWTL